MSNLRIVKEYMTKFELSIGDIILVVMRHEHEIKPKLYLRHENSDTVPIGLEEAKTLIEQEESRIRELKMPLDHKLADLRILRLQITETNDDISQKTIPSRFTTY